MSIIGIAVWQNPEKLLLQNSLVALGQTTKKEVRGDLEGIYWYLHFIRKNVNLRLIDG